MIRFEATNVMRPPTKSNICTAAGHVHFVRQSVPFSFGITTEPYRFSLVPDTSIPGKIDHTFVFSKCWVPGINVIRPRRTLCRIRPGHVSTRTLFDGMGKIGIDVGLVPLRGVQIRQRRGVGLFYHDAKFFRHTDIRVLATIDVTVRMVVQSQRNVEVMQVLQKSIGRGEEGFVPRIRTPPFQPNELTRREVDNTQTENTKCQKKKTRK